jgi:hypothetical protein
VSDDELISTPRVVELHCTRCSSWQWTQMCATPKDYADGPCLTGDDEIALPCGHAVAANDYTMRLGPPLFGPNPSMYRIPNSGV